MRLLFLLILLLTSFSFNLAGQSLTKYYGQSITEQPQLLAPGIISTDQGEYSPTFDVNRNELLFMRRTPGEFDYTIYISHFKNGSWSKPVIAPFSGSFRDAGISLSPDGNKAFFDSSRPVSGYQTGSINVWTVNRETNGWSAEAILLDGPSKDASDEPTPGRDEFGPVVDGDGNLYIYSFRQPYRNGSRFISEAPDYLNVERTNSIPDPSTGTFVSYLYISPDGRTALMDGRSDRGASGSIYFSCLSDQGYWSEAELLPIINEQGGVGGPSLSSDGEWLFFAGDYRNSNESPGNSDLYMISTKNLPVPCKQK
jgi:hypothetical protein